jgi:hypothetical protein
MAQSSSDALDPRDALSNSVETFMAALLGLPEGDNALSLPGCRELPADRLSGKLPYAVGSLVLPEYEKYGGPMSWEMFREREARLEQRCFRNESRNGEEPDPALCRRCRYMRLVRAGTFSDEEAIGFRPFGTWAQLLCRNNSSCMICRLVFFALSTAPPHRLHASLAFIDRELQGTQLCPMTLPFGETCLAVEFAFRRVSIIRIVTEANFREVVRQSYEHENGSVASFLHDRSSKFHDETGQRASIRTVLEWIRTCERKHGQKCSSIRHESATNVNDSILLIDVIDRRLVQSTTSSRYLALSYVWGRAPTPMTMLSNVQSRFEKGRLPEGLPATIEDFMVLAMTLGERYVWIDALCIVQDDPMTKADDIRKMDFIYSRAVATVVALHGTDANAGLPGVRSGTRPPQRISSRLSKEDSAEPDPVWVRRYDRLSRSDKKLHENLSVCNIVGMRLEDTTKLTDAMPASPDPPRNVRTSEAAITTQKTRRAATRGVLAMASHPPSLQQALHRSTWNTRGWTFQERLLSRRCLYFTADYVYFQCGTHTLCETGGNLLTWSGLTTAPESGNATDFARANETNPLLYFKQPAPLQTIQFTDEKGDDIMEEGILSKQDFDVYQDVIAMYSRLRLSFASDILHALAGILAVVRDRIGGEILAGCPSRYLDLALLWTPMEPADRRSPIGNGGSSFPSWSWAGWTGAKRYSLAEEGADTYRSLHREYAMTEICRIRIHHRGRLVEISKDFESMTATEARNLGTVAQPLEILFPKYIPFVETTLDSYEGPDFGPNVLQFWTGAVGEDAFTVAENGGTPLSSPEHANVPSKQVVCRMLDRRNRYCGLLFRPRLKTRYRGKTAGRLEFILVASFGESQERRKGLQTIDAKLRPFDEQEFPWRGPGSGLVNIMLIEWFDELAERLTVAQIHRQAWLEARPILKHIRLA